MIYSEKLNARFLCRIQLVFHSFNLLPATTNDFQQHLCKHRERRTLQIRAGSFCPLVCLRNRSITKSVSVHWGHLHFFQTHSHANFLMDFCALKRLNYPSFVFGVFIIGSCSITLSQPFWSLRDLLFKQEKQSGRRFGLKIAGLKSVARGAPAYTFILTQTTRISNLHALTVVVAHVIWYRSKIYTLFLAKGYSRGKCLCFWSSSSACCFNLNVVQQKVSDYFVHCILYQLDIELILSRNDQIRTA